MPQQDTFTGRFVRGNGQKPPLDSETIQQGALFPPHGGGAFGIAGRDIYACGNYANPCGFPGWGGGYRGTYSTYDFMLSHPVIAHARSTVFDACESGTWTVEFDKADPPPQAWIDFATKMFVPRRAQFYGDILRAIDYGWAPFEKVWEIRDGRYWLKDLKPLLHHWTWIVTERNGDFSGLSQGAWAANVQPLGKDQNGDQVPGLAPNKCFVYSHDQYAGYRYGRSRLENLRTTAWRDWLDTAQQLHRLGNRLVGIYLIGYTPNGQTQDPVTGQQINLRQSLVEGIQGMVIRGDPALIVTNLSLEVDDPELKAKLAASSLVKVDKLDFGNLAPAVDGLIRRQVHNEESFWHGYLRSPRVGSGETRSGSRADSERHTSTGDRDSQQICSKVDRSFSRDVFDDAMVINLGEKARGRMWLKTNDLDDDTPQMSLTFLGTAVQADKTVAERAMEVVDVKQVISNAGLPVTDKTWDETQADVMPPAPSPGTLPPNNQVPINQ